MPDEDKYAPRMIIYVEDDEVEREITNDIKSMEYEESTSLTDEMKLELDNSDGVYTDAVMWGPGNEVELWLGYTGNVKYLARTELTRHTPSFSSDGTMTLRLRGLDKGWRMKRQELELTGGRTPAKKLKATTRQWDGPIAGFVKKIAKRYGLKTDIARKFYRQKDKFNQKKGQSDFQALTALANFWRALFKIEYRREPPVLTSALTDIRRVTPGGAWYLVFQDFDRVTQGEAFTFRYLEGDISTVVEIEFDMSVADNLAEVQAYYWDPSAKGPDGKKGAWALVSEEEPRKIYKRKKIKAAKGEEADAEGFRWEPVKDKKGKQIYIENVAKDAKGAPVFDEKTGATVVEKRPKYKHVKKKIFVRDTDPFHRTYRSQRRKVRRGIQHPTKLRIAIAGYSLEILTRPFRNAADARQFIKSWVKANKDNFITAKGTLEGIIIRAGETHQIEGAKLGERYAGWYFFDSVTQKFDEGGWTTDFSAHRVFTPAWAPSATGEHLVTGEEFTIAVDSPSEEGL